MENLPDQHHINEIRKRLWCGGEYGQAVVMVGSGFSLNAQKTVPNAPDFPLWNKLGKEMYKALYPHKTSEYKASPLSLAAEYEAAFGREALDRFIVEIIPDTQHEPGTLHKLLMSLPWSDIYTTNYDTLLERTAQHIYDRKYDFVYTSEDIAGKKKPHIVKLHGSFPSHRPFIITEEDYRTYPSKFAPFVNMVQQSIMENIFCLIGFSGYDPNFLSWIGWVRDNLGDSMPTIYLCGFMDNLSDGKKRILSQKKITTIDLSPLFPEEVWSKERHTRGLEWFLLNLMYGEPEDNSQWAIPKIKSKPKSLEWKKTMLSIKLPKIPDTPQGTSKFYPEPNQFSLSSKITESISKDLKTIYEIWKEERQRYPGWIICPERNRKELWSNTKDWLHHFLDYSQQLPPCESILYLYELNWRLEKALIPLFEEWLVYLKNIINCFNPFPNYINIENSTITSQTNEYCSHNWNEIQEAWINLTFALMKEARENHKEQEFDNCKKLLSKVVHLNNEWKEKWYYEQCLFHLIRLEFEEVKITLNSWSLLNKSDYWIVKRSSILAEIGYLQEAQKETEQVLTNIRFKLSLDKVNYLLLSQESYTMAILEFLKRTQEPFNFLATEELIQVYRARFEQLAIYKCNPKQEVENLCLLIDKPRPFIPTEETEKHGFYPGTLSISYSWGGEDYWHKLLPAFQLLRLFDEVGIPMRCSFATNYPYSIIQASRWIATSAPLYAMGIMLRIGFQKDIEDWFSFVHVTCLSEENVAYLDKILRNYITRSYPILISSHSFIEDVHSVFSRTSVALSLFSLLCIKFDALQIGQAIDLAIQLYKSLPLINSINIQNEVKNLWIAIFYSLSKSELSKHLLNLLALPIINEDNYLIQEPGNWIDPFYYLKFENYHISRQDYDLILLHDRILHLIKLVRHGSAETRSWSILRLSRLDDVNGLDKDEQKLLTEALWSQVDSQDGLPANFNHLHKFALLYFSEIEIEFTQERIKNYLLSTNFPQIGTLTSFSGVEVSYLYNLLYATRSIYDTEDKQKLIDWKADEIEQLIEKIYKGMKNQEEVLRKWYRNNIGLSKASIYDFIKILIEILNLVIFPRFKDENKTQVKELIDIIESINSSWILTLSSGILIIEPDKYDEIAKKLRKGLFSLKIDEINYAIGGIYYWLIYGEMCFLSPPPSDLLDNLVNWVYSLRQPGLNYALIYLIRIVRNFPNLLQERHFEYIFLGLEYLLEETKLPNNWVELELQDPRSSILHIEKPEYRQLSSKLAYYLYQFLQKEKQPIPDILNSWKEQGLQDKLPEVRNIWQ